MHITYIFIPRAERSFSTSPLTCSIHYWISDITAVTRSPTQVMAALMFCLTLLLAEWPLIRKGLQRETEGILDTGSQRKRAWQGDASVESCFCLCFPYPRCFMSLNPIFCCMTCSLALILEWKFVFATECWLSVWGVKIKLTDNSISWDRGPTGQ